MKPIHAAVVLVQAAVLAQAAQLRFRHDIGSNYLTRIAAIAVDNKGFIYEAGNTRWPNFPTTPGPLSHYSGDSGSSLGGDVFVRKLGPDGHTVVYSVLIGGSRDEVCSGIAIDEQGNAFITGNTDSSDFPVTTPASQVAGLGKTNAFVFEIDPTGTKLVFSRMIGGTSYETVAGIALAPDGRVVIAGTTNSADFPTTPGAIQRAPSAESSAFVTRLSGGAIDYSTYLGGTGAANAQDVAVDDTGDMYVVGFAGAHFPTISGSLAPQAPFGGFVSKLDHASGGFVYSTYLPGVVSPEIGQVAMRLRVDAKHHAYVAGAASLGFPATQGAFQTEPSGDTLARYPASDAFVLELDDRGSHLVFATLFGDTGSEIALALELVGDSVAIAGVTTSPFLRLTDFGLPACIVSSLAYPSGVFVAQFNHTGRLLTSFEFGECNGESPTALTQSPSGLLLTGTRWEGKSSFLLSIDMTGRNPVQVEVVSDAADLTIGALAPLEIVSIFGTGLGPVNGVSATPSNGKYPSVLAGTRVFFAGTPASLLYVSENQINAVVPASPGGSWSSITVSTAAGSSPLLHTWLVQAVPGLFTTTGTGTGQGAILNEDFSLNSSSNPAARGSTVMLYGTGFGLTDPLFEDGQLAPVAAPLVLAKYLTANIGPTPVGSPYYTGQATVQYAGAVPGQINGLAQINVTIPLDAPTGPAIPVAVHLAGYRSRPGVTIAIR